MMALLPTVQAISQRILRIVLLLSIPWIAAALTVSSPPVTANRKIGGLGQAGDVDNGSPSRRVFVVGGGVGGLAVASRIAASSKEVKVTVLEKNGYAGGRCGSFEVVTGKGTFRHERGPSLLLLPDVYRDLFRDCEEACPLEIRQCTPAYQVIFDDGDCIDLGFPKQQNEAMKTYTNPISSAELLSRAKMNAFEPDGAAKWDEYMTACAAFLDCGLPNFIEERFDVKSFPAFLQQALRAGAKAWPLKPHSDVLDATFASHKMRALASFQDLYVGLEPYRNDKQLFGGVLQSTAPAVFGLLAAIELHPTNKKCGVYAPVGGFGAVTNAMEELATNLGVTIQCNTTVTQITADGLYYHDTNADSDSTLFEPADLVIVNADLPYATKTILLDDDSDVKSNAAAADRYDWDDKHRLSSGVVAFHWSVDKELTDLNTHNVFLIANSRSDAEGSWQALRNEKNSASSSYDKPFNFYIHRASKTDPTAAPKGCDAILVLVPCETLFHQADFAKLSRDEAISKYKDQFDDQAVSLAREAVFRRMAAIESLKDLRPHIIEEVVDTPGTYADLYNLAGGAPFGLSHGFAQLSLARPGPESSKLDNVMFCGASSRPGNGVPLVLMGAKLVAKRAISKLKMVQAEGAE